VYSFVSLESADHQSSVPDVVSFTPNTRTYELEGLSTSDFGIYDIKTRVKLVDYPAFPGFDFTFQGQVVPDCEAVVFDTSSSIDLLVGMKTP